MTRSDHFVFMTMGGIKKTLPGEENSSKYQSGEGDPVTSGFAKRARSERTFFVNKKQHGLHCCPCRRWDGAVGCRRFETTDSPAAAEVAHHLSLSLWGGLVWCGTVVLLFCAANSTV